jgi:hypothetical protein
MSLALMKVISSDVWTDFHEICYGHYAIWGLIQNGK